MTLDECVYILADLLDEVVDADKARHLLKKILARSKFTIDEVEAQFTVDYACLPDTYVQNIQEDKDFLLDSEFDSP